MTLEHEHGSTAELDGQERAEWIAELVRHDALLVVAQVQEVARRLGRRRRPRLGGTGARRHGFGAVGTIDTKGRCVSDPCAILP